VNFDMAAIERDCFGRIAGTGDAFEYLLPNASLAPTRKAVVDGLVRAVCLGAILPAATNLQHMHDPAQDAAIVLALGAWLVHRQVRNDFLPLLVTEPEQVRVHGLGLHQVDQATEPKHG